MSDDLFPDGPRRSYLESLKALIMPHVNAADLESEQDWEAVELDLGISLPDSYKKVCRFLPGGFLGDQLTWASPFSKGRYAELTRVMLEDTYGDWPSFSDVPLYPAIPGYLVFVTTSIRLSFAYRVTLESDETAMCLPEVFILDGDVDRLEETGLEVDELLYRCITWEPPLEGSLAEHIHENEFEERMDLPLFRRMRSEDEDA